MEADKWENREGLKEIEMSLREISFEDVDWIRTMTTGGTCY